MNSRRAVTASGATVMLLSAVVCAGCAAVPVDPDGTFERARGGTLVVGVSEHPPWTEVRPGEGDGGGDVTVTGPEADLVTGFAATIDAGIEWRAGPESVLAQAADEGEVDIVVGGLGPSSPWEDHFALTRPYVTSDGEDRVLGVRMGENRLLTELERYLAEQGGELA